MKKKSLFTVVFLVLMLSGANDLFSRPASKKSDPEPGKKEEEKGAQGESEEDPAKLQNRVQTLEARVEALKSQLQKESESSRLYEERSQEVRDLKKQIKIIAERASENQARVTSIEQTRVLSEHEESRKPGSWVYGYDHGFYTESPKKRFRLKMDGYILARYGMAFVGNVPAEHRILDPYGWPDKHGFELTNARLGVSGHIYSPKMGYKVRLEMAGSPNLTNVELNWQPLEMMRITVGQTKVPDSYQSLQSTGKLQLDDRSAATNSFASGYDQGALITFTQLGGKLFEQIGAFNGAKRNFPNDNMALQYILRVGTRPLGAMPKTESDPGRTTSPRVHLATSLSYQKSPTGDVDGDSVGDDKHVLQAGAEAAFAWQGFTAAADFHYRFEDHGEALKDSCPVHYEESGRSCSRFQKFWGIYGQVGYFVWRDLQLAGRYSYTQVFENRFHDSAQTFEPSFGSVQPVSGLNPDEVHEAGGGVSYLMFNQKIRVGLYYSFFWERGYDLGEDMTEASRKLHWVRVQTRLTF